MRAIIIWIAFSGVQVQIYWNWRLVAHRTRCASTQDRSNSKMSMAIQFAFISDFRSIWKHKYSIIVWWQFLFSFAFSLALSLAMILFLLHLPLSVYVCVWCLIGLFVCLSVVILTSSYLYYIQKILCHKANKMCKVPKKRVFNSAFWFVTNVRMKWTDRWIDRPCACRL